MICPKCDCGFIDTPHEESAACESQPDAMQIVWTREKCKICGGTGELPDGTCLTCFDKKRILHRNHETDRPEFIDCPDCGA
jgi:DnaJ-class molecular chaperone